MTDAAVAISDAPQQIKLTAAQKDQHAFHRWLTKKHPGMAHDHPQYVVLRSAFIAGRQSGIASLTVRDKRAAPQLEIVSFNHIEQSITVLVGGVRYCYTIGDGFALCLSRIEYMIKQNRHGSALNELKRRALSVQKF